jgi:hypothetical protein
MACRLHWRVSATERQPNQNLQENVMNKLAALALAFGLLGSSAAHAAYQSKADLAASVTAKTKAAQSHVLGFSANRKTAYVLSEGTKKGNKYVMLRRVSANTGAIQATKNVTGALKQMVALKERNGAVGGQKGDFLYSVKLSKDAMSVSGKTVTVRVMNAGFPGRAESRSVKVSKSGLIQSITDKAGGTKSRW